MSVKQELPGLNDVSRLKLARLGRGFTQRDVERRAGLPPTSLSHYEAGRRVPGPVTRFRLAQALEVDVEIIFPHLESRHR
jgi:transcriptional regulator with XRE-family HTH domain